MSGIGKELLNTKKHFEVLDGLRGVAAIAVVVFHFMEIAIPDSEKNFIAHGYLAVDFFFCLSGFVIAYAYDTRVRQIGIRQFIKLRLIRLHPLVLIGAVLGILGFLLDPFSDLYTRFSMQQLLFMFLSAGFLIPYPVVSERYLNLFHLNPPTWSLFWEYLANIAYVLFLYKIKKRGLYVLLVIAALLLVYECNRFGHLSIGWGAGNIRGGGIRVLYSFVAGMMLYRHRWIMQSRLGFGLISILLLGMFLVPFTHTTSAWVDAVVVLFCFPLLVALGAGVSVTGTGKKVCGLLGAISYPLYMVHYPFMWIFFSYVEKYKPAMQEMAIITITGTLLLIGFSYLVMIFLDIPVRKFLKKINS